MPPSHQPADFSPQMMPGQTVSCVGCHESRQQTAPPGTFPVAARRPAVALRSPSYCVDGIVDFPTVVQPVLDKYCVRCHSGADPKGAAR